MLLETLDLRNKDILIYSQNKFNFNENFKIIFKNEKVKRPHRISYFDVCTYVKDPSPKNIIIYRLLTNVTHLDAYSSKYGYFIKVNGKIELVYFDPIFAIKDLRHLRFDLDPDRFRFKIQQVGLTSLTKRESNPDPAKNSESNFSEVYSFDLKAIEAQNQNDKVFADAIFAFDEYAPELKENYADVADPFERRGNESSYNNNDFKPNPGLISEDKGPRQQPLTPLAAPSSDKAQDLREEIVSLLKQALGIEEQKRIENSELRMENKFKEDSRIKSEKDKPINEYDDKHLFDLFKSASKDNEISKRERETVVLKFK